MTPAKNKSTAAAVASATALIVSGFVPHTDDAASDLVDYQSRCSQAQAFHTLYLPKVTAGRMRFTDGEAHRPQSTAAYYAKQGIGIANSLHTQRLAQDKMLIVDGVYSPRAADYQLAGEIWEAIGPAFGVQATWGGRFNDANHFSCSWKGIK